MSNENPLAEIKDMPAAKIQDDSVFDAVTTSQAYLPRIQLLTSSSEKCKSGEFPTNHYARVHDSNYRDLGSTVDVLIVAWRPLAIETTPEGDVITCYDPCAEDGQPTGDFARIQAEADKPGMNGCMYGPQFLLWVPSEKEFMTFFMASKTARRASSAVKALMHKPATIGSQKIESKDYTWFGPTCQACSTPFEMPEKEEVKAQMEAFLNPPEPDVKVDSEDGGQESEDGTIRE